MSEVVKPYYECPHCFKKLTSQVRLDKHTCEKKKRYDFLRTPRGRGALECYKKWFKYMKRGSPDAETFMESRFYNSINNFIKFSLSVGIPDRDSYIKYMVEKELDPSKWESLDLYNEFIIYFDENTPPEKLAEITIETVYDLADKFECEVNEVLSNLYAADLARLVHARRLSPWLLIPSKSFNNYIKYETNAQQKILIDSVIDRKKWAAKFRERPDVLKRMQTIVTSMDF
jgi:uncharacterized short protein YbdD (DUF466 family)